MQLSRLHQNCKKLRFCICSLCFSLILFSQTVRSQNNISLIDIDPTSREILLVELKYVENDDDKNMCGWFNPIDSSFMNCNTGSVIKNGKLPKGSQIKPNNNCPCNKDGLDKFQLLNLPLLEFKEGTSLTENLKAELEFIAVVLRDNPGSHANVDGFIGDVGSKRLVQLSGDRVLKVINYLVKNEGISDDRLIPNIGISGGFKNTVKVQLTSSK